MNIIFELKTKNKIFMNSSFSLKTGDQPVLKFKTAYEMKNGKIRLKNGILEKSFDYSEDFLIPEEFIFEGRLFVRVEMILLGKIVKHWELSPLKIVNVDDGYEFQDEMTDLQNRLTECEKKLKVLEDKHRIHL